MSHDMTKRTKWVYAQRTLRSAWASAQSDQSLRCVLSGYLRTQAFYMQTAKTLIRLGGCPGWSESSLGSQSFRWLCHVAAEITNNGNQNKAQHKRRLGTASNKLLVWGGWGWGGGLKLICVQPSPWVLLWFINIQVIRSAWGTSNSSMHQNSKCINQDSILILKQASGGPPAS